VQGKLGHHGVRTNVGIRFTSGQPEVGIWCGVPGLPGAVAPRRAAADPTAPACTSACSSVSRTWRRPAD